MSAKGLVRRCERDNKGAKVAIFHGHGYVCTSLEGFPRRFVEGSAGDGGITMQRLWFGRERLLAWRAELRRHRAPWLGWRPRHVVFIAA